MSGRALIAATVGLAAALSPAVAAPPSGAGGPQRAKAGRGTVWPNPPYPAPAQVRAAERFASERPGSVAFAVIDDGGRMRGTDAGVPFSSASASKALLLAAELRRLRAGGLPLDDQTRALLTAMITYSDNDAADAIYARVGDAGLSDVAEAAGMESFSPVPGFWGGDQITAADMARFYLHLERNLVGQHAPFGLRLLGTVDPDQRWGIPAAAAPGWTVWFKGGWRPPGQKGTTGAVTHQAGLLRHRTGERLGLAVLTDESPDADGLETIEGITERLLAVPPPRWRWPAG